MYAKKAIQTGIVGLDLVVSQATVVYPMPAPTDPASWLVKQPADDDDPPERGRENAEDLSDAAAGNVATEQAAFDRVIELFTGPEPPGIEDPDQGIKLASLWFGTGMLRHHPKGLGVSGDALQSGVVGHYRV